MLICKEVISTEYIALSKRLRCTLLEGGAQGRVGIRREQIPGLRQAIGRVKRPGWACQLIPLCQVFSCPRAKGGPVFLFFCWVLRHLDRLVQKLLAATHMV